MFVQKIGHRANPLPPAPSVPGKSKIYVHCRRNIAISYNNNQRNLAISGIAGLHSLGGSIGQAVWLQFAIACLAGV